MWTKSSSSIKNVIIIMTGAQNNGHTNPLFKKIKVAKLQIAKYMYNCFQRPLPPPLAILFISNETIYTRDTWNRPNPHVVQRRISITSKSLHHKDPAIWYLIPKEITSFKN